MKKQFIAVLGFGMTFIASVATAQVTLYQNERFHGPTFTSSGPINNLARVGFNDRASSAIIDFPTASKIEGAGSLAAARGRFDGDVVVRSHLRMTGRWRVRERGGTPQRGAPWLVLRTREWEAAQWNGPVLSIGAGRVRGSGPPRGASRAAASRPHTSEAAARPWRWK